jgi:uncharacterized delta-60 repeat protein
MTHLVLRFPRIRILCTVGGALLLHGILCSHAQGAAGSVDLSFDPGSGVSGTVRTVVLQPDGKIIIGGEFTTVRGLARVNLARLHADGSGDAAFNAGNNASGGLQSIALQSDGKVLLTVGGPYWQAARLNSDGSLDHSFTLQHGNSPHGSSLTVVAEQPNGKVLFGGYFRTEFFDAESNTYHSYERFRIYRVHPDGTPDGSFAYDNSAVTYGIGVLALRCLVLQPDGKVLIGGFGSMVSGANHRGIARLNADGSADSTFNPGAGANESGVSSIALQSDGRVLIGGFFSAVHGTSRNRIARLHANGSLDTSFDPGSGANHTVFSVALQADGKVLMGGFFSAVNGASRHKVARLNGDGSLDPGFNPGSGTDRIVHSVVVPADGKVLIGGSFTTIEGANRERMARLNSDGTADSSFHPGAAVNGMVTSLALQPDGNILIGGRFTSVHGTSRKHIARLNANGSLNSNFESRAPFDDTLIPEVKSVVVQADGKVLIGTVNELTAIGTPPPPVLVRLHADGTVDNGFIAEPGPFVHAIALQSDGRMLIGTGLSWGDVDEVVRLNANGSRDTGFAAQVTGPAGSIGNAVTCLAIQPNGKVLAGGWSVYPGEQLVRPLLNRLNADGSRDTGFEQLEGEEFEPAMISAVALQPDGKVLIGGDFTIIKGRSRNSIARLNADGTLDLTFDPGTGADTGTGTIARVDVILVQSDAMILIGGRFSTFNGTVRNHIARLGSDGSLDTGFNPGTGCDGPVSDVALQGDGNVLIGGDFTTVNGVPRRGVARLYGGSPPSSSFVVWISAFGFSGADADPDRDGLPNAVEYILGGNPAVTDTSGHPTATVSGGSLLFIFSRNDASETPDVTLTVVTGTDLVTWPAVFNIGPDTSASTPGVSISENGAAPDVITVAIPIGADKAGFARMKVRITP